VLFILSPDKELVAIVINAFTSSKVLQSLLANFLLRIAQIFSTGFSLGLQGGKNPLNF
jgi:hypothetical protein